MKPHHVRDRRRSIHFDGRTVTLMVATKYWGFMPKDTHYEFRVSKLTDVKHTEATKRDPGEVVFVAPNASTAIVTNVPSGCDELPGNTFRYDYPKLAKVKAFVEAVEKARKK
ncbi:hypothetical protein AB0L41_01080 [Amycolatopsis mediterranei]|uniref:hypothetical protein n=1 Tax=Amycolatopsis mediterranei TaxID=33910 RepID=UPI00343D166B